MVGLMDKLLQAWDTGEFTDEQLCKHFEVSLIELRLALVKYDRLTKKTDLSINLKRELFRYRFRHSYTAEDLLTFDESIELAYSGNFVAHEQHRDYDEIRAEIMRLRAEGFTNVEIAEELGYHPSRISQLAPTGNKKGRYRKLSPEEWDKLLAQLEEHSASSLAVIYGVSRSNIYYKARQRGIKL